MSRAVCFECQSCSKARSDSINHGEVELSKMWALREHVLAIANVDAFDIEARCPTTYGSGDWFAFIAAHFNHDVILVDEYGGRGPIGPGRCLRKASVVEVVKAFMEENKLKFCSEFTGGVQFRDWDVALQEFINKH